MLGIYSNVISTILLTVGDAKTISKLFSMLMWCVQRVFGPICCPIFGIMRRDLPSSYVKKDYSYKGLMSIRQHDLRINQRRNPLKVSCLQHGQQRVSYSILVMFCLHGHRIQALVYQQSSFGTSYHPLSGQSMNVAD